jgi:hypothetical protein
MARWRRCRGRVTKRDIVNVIKKVSYCNLQVSQELSGRERMTMQNPSSRVRIQTLHSRLGRRVLSTLTSSAEIPHDFDFFLRELVKTLMLPKSAEGHR